MTKDYAMISAIMAALVAYWQRLILIETSNERYQSITTQSGLLGINQYNPKAEARRYLEKVPILQRINYNRLQ